MNDFLPFALASIGQEEINEVVDTLRSGWLTTGPRAKRFEDEFAHFIGARHALAVSSATAGLHLALEAIGVGPGDKVIVPTYTFTATAEVVRYLGADPVFVDIDARTMNLDVACVANATAQHNDIKAIVPVHFAGLAADMDPLVKLARSHGLLIVEDAAHALPATYQGSTIGTIGDITVFSFYATKTLATGEGGMVVTDNPRYADRIRTMRLHGINRDVFDRYTSSKASWYYEVVAPGFKYNLPDIAAAIGLHQLAKVESFRAARENIARRYSAAFSSLPVQLPAWPEAGDIHSWHLYPLRLDLDELPIGRDAFIERLKMLGIGSSVHFIPLHMHPYWKETYSLRVEDFPVATREYNREVSLPIYPAMKDADVDRVIDAVGGILSAS